MASLRPRFPPYLLLLIVAFALLGLIAFQTIRDRAFWNDLLEEKDSDIRRLEKDLQREAKRANELHGMFRKLESQHYKLKDVTEDLRGQLTVLKHINTTIEDDKTRLESSLQDSEIEVSYLKEKLDHFQKNEQELKNIQDEIVMKDTEINELKARLTKAQVLMSVEESVTAPVGNSVNERSKGSHKGEERTEQDSHPETEGDREEERQERTTEGEGRLTEEQGDTERDREEERQERTTDTIKENEGVLKGDVGSETSSNKDVDEDGASGKNLEEVVTKDQPVSKYSETKGATDDMKENGDIFKGNGRDDNDDVDDDDEAEKNREELERKDQQVVDTEAIGKADHEENELETME